ncbi:MAG: hypothetical protein ACRD6X_17505 [Pyrinomonadaceae bacterium]
MAVYAELLIPATHSAVVNFVITGFNTDVEFNGVTYHVQTEDKGLETPFILTLVYDRGTILASKRQPYDDLFAKGFDETELAARLQRQHSLTCAAINAGRLRDLIELTLRESKNRSKETEDVEESLGNIPKPSDIKDAAAPIPKPSIGILATHKTKAVDTEPLVDVVNIIEDEFVIPNDAVEIVSQMAGRERPSHDRLCLEFVNETPFKGGENKTVTFMVSRGTQRKVVDKAEILVKIIGSKIKPRIFHSVTDKNGLAKLELEMPEFAVGRAAFLVRASVAGEEIEVRRSISHSD